MLIQILKNGGASIPRWLATQELKIIMIRRGGVLIRKTVKISAVAGPIVGTVITITSELASAEEAY